MGELLQYSERQRDRVESTPIKRQLLERVNGGIRVEVFWQKLGNICTLFLFDEKENTGTEFVIPNDKVMDYYEHPFSHPDAHLPQYKGPEAE